jgi:hypothetical protein
LTLTMHFCDVSQSFVSATKSENTSSYCHWYCWLRQNKNSEVSFS